MDNTNHSSVCCHYFANDHNVCMFEIQRTRYERNWFSVCIFNITGVT